MIEEGKEFTQILFGNFPVDMTTAMISQVVMGLVQMFSEHLIFP